MNPTSPIDQPPFDVIVPPGMSGGSDMMEKALSTKQRNKLPKSRFAGPGRSYPVNDPAHAAAAKSRATQAVNAGRMSKSQQAKINAKANKVLNRKSGK